MLNQLLELAAEGSSLPGLFEAAAAAAAEDPVTADAGGFKLAAGCFERLPDG